MNKRSKDLQILNEARISAGLKPLEKYPTHYNYSKKNRIKSAGLKTFAIKLPSGKTIVD